MVTVTPSPGLFVVLSMTEPSMVPYFEHTQNKTRSIAAANNDFRFISFHSHSVALSEIFNQKSMFALFHVLTWIYYKA